MMGCAKCNVPAADLDASGNVQEDAGFMTQPRLEPRRRLFSNSLHPLIALLTFYITIFIGWTL